MNKPGLCWLPAHRLSEFWRRRISWSSRREWHHRWRIRSPGATPWERNNTTLHCREHRGGREEWEVGGKRIYNCKWVNSRWWSGQVHKNCSGLTKFCKFPKKFQRADLSVCFSRVAMHWWLPTSQTRTIVSSLLEARRQPSGEKARPRTAPLWPVRSAGRELIGNKIFSVGGLNWSRTYQGHPMMWWTRI